ncbi:MAG: hypothetical protein WAW17_21005 [Rhodococcus sp. (in: high G+C Gram-positive bacteria)]|uniref:hypothetical protein n=1 Tax=Rhodococcus sp. TaxID=1831 RepID=UPI003BB0CFCD
MTLAWSELADVGVGTRAASELTGLVRSTPQPDGVPPGGGPRRQHRPVRHRHR